jgi:hypothetical protein
VGVGGAAVPESPAGEGGLYSYKRGAVMQKHLKMAIWALFFAVSTASMLTALISVVLPPAGQIGLRVRVRVYGAGNWTHFDLVFGNHKGSILFGR